MNKVFLTLAFIAISFIGWSQEGYYHVVKKDTTAGQTEVEISFNEEVPGEDVIPMTPNTKIRLDLENLKTIKGKMTLAIPSDLVTKTIETFPENEIDTLIVTECFTEYNKKIWLHRTDEIDVYPHEVAVPFQELSLVRVQVDSLPIWKKLYQHKWKLERTKHFRAAWRTYRELDIPFQFFVDDSIISIAPTVARVRVFGSEDWYPEVIVNGVSRGPTPEHVPGSQDFHGYITRRHSIGIDNLTPGTQYAITIKGYCREDETETDETTFIIETPLN